MNTMVSVQRDFMHIFALVYTLLGFFEDVGGDGETFHSLFEADCGELGGVDPELEQHELN